MALYVHVLSFWLVVEVLIILILVRSCKNDKMEGFSEPQMEGYVNSFNYPIEVYNVETSDGYILKLFRIPHGKYNKSESKGPPIILMHAFMASSESYVMLGENQSLAFLAAEAGYDVWMPNARGNTHSRKHKTLNPDKDFSFWNFSWHEIGTIDLPCIIDFIMNKTKFAKVSYIGHSQGGTVLFVMTSEKPEYKEKINVVIGLAPAVYLNNFDHPYLMDFVDNFEAIYEGHSMVKSGERIFYSNYSDIRYLLFAFKGLLPSLIIKYWTLFTGESEVSNWAQLFKFLGTLPAGSSIKQMAHFAQLINYQSFIKFDYGTEENLKRYNASTPPLYNLIDMDLPVYLFGAKNDLMVSINDLKLLKKYLPNVKGFEVMPFKKFNHLDFILANNLDIILNNKILQIINSF